MLEMFQPILAASVRHALTFAAGYLVASHVIPSEQAGAVVAAGMTIAGVAWSWWQKVGQAKVAALLKKLTKQSTVAAATEAAKVLPAGSAMSKDLPAPGVAAVAQRAADQVSK